MVLKTASVVMPRPRRVFTAPHRSGVLPFQDSDVHDAAAPRRGRGALRRGARRSVLMLAAAAAAAVTAIATPATAVTATAATAIAATATAATAIAATGIAGTAIADSAIASCCCCSHAAAAMPLHCYDSEKSRDVAATLSDGQLVHVHR